MSKRANRFGADEGIPTFMKVWFAVCGLLCGLLSVVVVSVIVWAVITLVQHFT